MAERNSRSKTYWKVIGIENPKLPTWHGYIPAMICIVIAFVNIDTAGGGPTGVENDFEIFLKWGLILAAIRMVYTVGFDNGRAYESSARDEECNTSE